jgi:hypothetical protein
MEAALVLGVLPPPTGVMADVAGVNPALRFGSTE